MKKKSLPKQSSRNRISYFGKLNSPLANFSFKREMQNTYKLDQFMVSRKKEGVIELTHNYSHRRPQRDRVKNLYTLY